jgi:16S rRNA (uracil1498-N3)-methyltransferase
VPIRRIFMVLKDPAQRWIEFPPEAAHYLRTVLRLKPGDHVEVFDGRQEYLVQLTQSEQGGVRGEVVESRPTQSQGPLITLAFGCVRPGPLQEILRHGTELGVCRFVPILSRRTTRRPNEQKERWQTIAASAAAQCGRTDVPIIEPPTAFADFITGSWRASTNFILSTRTNAPDLLSNLGPERRSDIVLLVGPEGGFDSSEEDQAIGEGFQAVRLGRTVLRTETAAVAAVAVVVSWWERLRAGSEGRWGDCIGTPD